jgi:hypothetical protein
VALALVAPAGVAGCSPVPTDFECIGDESCRTASGAAGWCEPTRHCSVADDSCPSLRRYVDYAGELSNRCTAEASCTAELRAGDHATCARTSDGGVRCWGAGMQTPARLTVPDGEIAEVALGGAGLCVRYASHAVWCAPRIDQPLVKIEPLEAIGIAVGATHICAVTVPGGVACWGSNTEGELGDGTNLPRTAPTPTTSSLAGVRQVSAGNGITCAVTDAEQVWCWGNDDDGQLGRGILPSNRTVPMPVQGTTRFTAVSLGDSFACALAGGGVWCWGKNDRDQIGDRSGDSNQVSPTQVPSLTGVSRITTGGKHACAIGSDRVAVCWGDNAARQSAGAAMDRLAAPTPVLDAGGQPLHFAEIDGGTAHTCGLTGDGLAVCWGGNTGGEIGDGTAAPATAPTPPLVTCP